MNSKERAATALSGEIPDKVPLGDFSIDYDTVERILGHETYVRAKAKCQIAYWEGRRDEVVQSLVEDTIALYKKLEIYDIINLCAMTLGLVPPKGYEPQAPKRIDATTWRYPDGRVLKYSHITADITLVHDPEKWTREIREEDYPLEFTYEAPDPSVYELVNAVTSEFSEDRFILGPFPKATEWVQPGGMERSLIEMVDNPSLVERALHSSLARARIEQAHWTNRGIHGVMDGTDWAFRSGPFMSPQMWRRFCYPALQNNVEAAHEAGLLFVQHACGNNWPILEGFMEAGVDCYQSIQATAEMDLTRVQEATRGRMALWGGVLVEHLVDGTPDQVRQDVREAMRIAKPDGAFVLGASHSIAVGTCYDNFMTMLDEFDRLRDY
ncbi:MAG: uroporphyrinogen decarboxylase family protein [Anaerolineales bacterium]